MIYIFFPSDNRFAVLVAERERRQQMSVEKPYVMLETPAVTSEQSVSVTIETGCTVALQLANEHRQYFRRCLLLARSACMKGLFSADVTLYFIFLYYNGRLGDRVDLIKWVSNVRPPVRTSVRPSFRPQKVSSILMTFGM